MPELVLKSTGKPVYVADDAIGDAIASGLYEPPAGGQKVAVEVRPGLVGETNVEDLGAAQAQGSTVETDASFRKRERDARLEREHGGIGGKIATGLEAAADTVTLGGYGVVADAIGGEEYREDRLGRAEINPGPATVGKIAGVVATLPAGGSGTGALAKAARATPLGAVTRIGGRIAKAGEGASTLVKAGRLIGGGALEGGAQGLGTGIEALNNSDDPLTIERVSSVLGSHVLFGGAVGAGANIVAKGAEAALTSAKRAIDRAVKSSASPVEEFADLAGLDAAGLRNARAAELEALAAGKTSERAAAAEGIGAYQQAVKEANPWAVVEGEASAEIAKANSAIRRQLGNKAGLAENPGRVLDALQRQEQALAHTIDNAGELATKLAERNAKFATKLEAAIAKVAEGEEVALKGPLGRKFGQFDGVKVPRGGEVAASRERAQAFLDALKSGEIKSAEEAAIKKLPDLLEQNKRLQETIRSSTVPKSELASARLTAIDNAKDALVTGGAKKGIAEQMAGGAAFGAASSVASAIPVVGPLVAPFAGAAAARAVSEKLFGALAKGAGQTAERMSKAVGALLDVTKRVQPAAPVLATQVLGAVAFGDKKDSAVDKKSKRATKPSLENLYRARSEEIRSQVTAGPDGQPVVRPDARARVADRLAPIAAVDPVLADRIETQKARSTAYLARILPKRPDLGGIETGPDRHKPSDFEMRSWARSVAAVEDPAGILERLAAGTVTPEDAEVMRHVYPEMLADITKQILEQLPTLRRTLPYERRLSLSIFTGAPVDPSMRPEVLAVLQGTFAREAGTDGGVHGPMPQPQFGSVRDQEATAAQKREGAAT